MNTVLTRREDIYNYFHANQACQKYFFDDSRETEFVAYYTSMYLLQDSTESLCWHRKQGFSTDACQAYLELWGVLQAVIIQQDSIAEMFHVVTGGKMDAKPLVSWCEIRHFRNVCAGHPVKRDLPKKTPLTRSFMGRRFGGYDSFTYEQWEQGVGTTHPRKNLGALLDGYATEAEAKLTQILVTMRSRWP
jgi:hypothetical protein